MPVQYHLAVLTQETDVHGVGMQVDAAVQWMLVGVEAPEIRWRRTGHPHGALVQLLEAFCTTQARCSAHSPPAPHDR
jgi:hypothetical protein